MSKLNDIKRKIDELDGGAFQNLCDAYLACKGYKNGYSLGMYTGTDKTAKGNPDTYFVTDDNKYVFVMYTTQKTSFVIKAKEDIDKCFDKEKTGIASNEIVEVIYCHTYGRLLAGEDKELRDYCLQKGAKLTLIGLDVLGNDIFLSYPILAKDKLGISVDSGQINDVDNFIMLHDRNKLSAPLDTEFLFRKTEFDLAKDLIEKSNILLLYGSAGVGKTRFAIEICRKLVESQGYELLCIKSNSLEIFEDLVTAIEPDKQYLVLVDDANELTGLHYILDYLQQRADSTKQISKVVLTVRDYAHRKVLNEVLNYEKPEIIKLSPLKDEDIRTLIDKRYGIANNRYSDRIVKIAEGNARIAMLAAKLLVEQGDIESIRDATSLYSQYYEHQLNSILSGSRTEICTAGIVAFLQVIYLERLDRFQSVFDSVSLTIDVFLDDLKHLHNLELVNLCRDKVAKIADQSFSNFLIKYVFFDKKYIPFDLMLRICFEINRNRTIEACNILINVFGDKSVQEYVEEQINNVWNELKDKPDMFVPFFNAFHMINPTESLLILQNQIDNEDTVDYDATSIEFKADDSKTIENEIISNLCSYKYTEQLPEAIELLLLLYEKRPDLFLEVYSALTYVLGIDKDSAEDDYYTQKTIVSNLCQKMNGQVDDNFKLLFVRVAIFYLRFVFSYTESGRKHAFTLYTIPIATSKNVIEYRKLLLNRLKSFYESNQYCAEILAMLKGYGSDKPQRINYDLVKEEYDEIISLMRLLDTNNLYHCCIVAHLEKVYLQAEFSYEETLFFAFTKSKKYQIYDTLKGGRKYLDLSYEEEKVKRRADIEYLVRDYDMSDYEYMFSVCDEIERLPNRDEYAIGKSLSYVFELALTNQVVYTEIVEMYLKMNTPCNARAATIVSALFSFLTVQDVKALINKYDYEQKSSWQWEYFVEMPLGAIGQIQVNELFSYLATPDLALKSSGHRPIYEIKKYEKIDSDIIVSCSSILLQHYDDSPFVFSLYFTLMFDHEITSDQLFEWYSSDMILLKQIYLKMIFYNSHVDYKGRFLVGILKTEPSFVFEYLEVMIKDKRKIYQKYDEYVNRLRRVWRADDYLEKIQIIVDYLYSEFGNHKWSFSNCVELLLSHGYGEESIVERQYEWLDNTIENNIQNEDYLIYLFDAVSELSDEMRRVALVKFLSLCEDYSVFEKLSLESRSYGGTGSMIPHIQKHITYLESIKPYFSSVKFLRHKKFIEQRIQWWQNEIKAEEVRELLEEWG